MHYSKRMQQRTTQSAGETRKAWRTLDEDDSNVASWDEFERMCNLVAFKGNRGGAWRALDTDISGSITLTEWHPPSARLLVARRGGRRLVGA